MVADLKFIGGDKEGHPLYAGTVGNPKGIEVVVAGIPPDDWHVFGIRGFGQGFPGDHGSTLTADAIEVLNKAVAAGGIERYEVDGSGFEQTH